MSIREKINAIPNRFAEKQAYSEPCPDCRLTQDASGTFKYGSETTGYTTSRDRETAKKKHRSAYPDAYIPKGYEKPKASTDTTVTSTPKLKQ